MTCEPACSGTDFLVAHRVAQDHAYDLARITAARNTLEQRVLLALTETAPPDDHSAVVDVSEA